jgi:hypothetical protein
MPNKLILFISLLLISGFGFRQEKPRILIIGDSISIGYTPFVKKALSDKAIVQHNAGNAKFSSYGLEQLDHWLGNEKWDIIQFNWGLWDLCYRDPSKEALVGNRDKKHGAITATKSQYKANLEAIVKRLKQSGAKLIFVTTTVVPENEPGRYPADVVAYNKIAKGIMKKNGIVVNDIFPLSQKVHQQFGLGSDNVHYNAQGYQALSVQVVDKLNQLLGN